MAPWPGFGDLVVVMTKATAMVQGSHSRARRVGHGWSEPKHSATLNTVEEMLKQHIQNTSGPGYHMPHGWALMELPVTLDVQLTALYTEMMRGSMQGNNKFHKEYLLLCVMIRIAWTPQLAVCQEDHVASAMGFGVLNRTTFVNACGKFIDYLKALPPASTMLAPMPHMLPPPLLPMPMPHMQLPHMQLPPLPPLPTPLLPPPMRLVPRMPEPMLQVVATLIGPPLPAPPSPHSSDEVLAMTMMGEMEASGELDELLATLPPMPPPSPTVDEFAAVIDEMEAEEAVELVCSYYSEA